MNERLKELMVEAGYAAPELAGRANNLAELIVRECASWIEKQDCAVHPTAWLLCDEIKEHFGVE